MKRITDHTIRTLLALLPLAAASCASGNMVSRTTPPRDIDIVQHPAAPRIDPSMIGGPAVQRNKVIATDDYNADSALAVSFGERPPHPASGTPGISNNPGRAGHAQLAGLPATVRRDPPSTTTPARPSRGSLIGLYGEIAPETSGESDPYDGNRNLTQVTFTDEGACFDPDVDPTGHWLVFASTRHRDTADLYVKSTTGKTITQITTDPADDLMPSFDPTGKRIAFASNREGNWNIYITTMEGGQAMQLTSGAEDALHPTWSPDGTHIAYCKFGAQSGRWEIWTVAVDSPGVHSFLDYGLFPRWSPDVARSKILFQRSRQRGSRFHSIWTIDYANGESMYPTEIVSAANAAVINPTWSPDGRRIAFVTIVDPDTDAGAPAQSDIWIINADGTNRTMLTNGDFANYQPVWASSGAVYFVSNRSGQENIWAVGTPHVFAPDEGIVTVDPERERDRP